MKVDTTTTETIKIGNIPIDFWGGDVDCESPKVLSFHMRLEAVPTRCTFDFFLNDFMVEANFNSTIDRLVSGLLLLLPLLLLFAGMLRVPLPLSSPRKYASFVGRSGFCHFHFGSHFPT